MAKRLWLGTRKGLLTLVKKGSGPEGWKVTGIHMEGNQVPVFAPDTRDGSVVACMKSEHFGVKLHRSDDGGKTFNEIATPVYPEKPKDVEDVDPARQTEVPWSLINCWVIEPSLSSRPGVLWCGTTPGGLFVSQDRGDSWTMVMSLWNHPLRKQWFGGGTEHPAIHSIVVDPRDANHVQLAVSCGGVWDTRNNGETWTCDSKGMIAEFMPPEQQENPAIQDAHRLVNSPSAPDVLWVQHHNGIFKSEDGGANWRSLSTGGSTFGFAVAAHPTDPKTAWFVPGVQDSIRIPPDGKLVVTRTRDGGESFEWLREGLPQEHAYDIVFRHALDVDETGDVLAFGSTTGNLFLSENGGNSWHCVSSFLPPVYSVRFEKALP